MIPGCVKEHSPSQVYKAIKILRNTLVVVVDCGQHDVLYDPGMRSVTMVNFELMQAREEETMSPDLPEMHAIFKDVLFPSTFTFKPKASQMKCDFAHIMARYMCLLS